MIIERATLADKDVLLDLMQKQFLEHEIPHSAGILEAAIREMITRDSLGIILVARDDDHVIGLAAIPWIPVGLAIRVGGLVEAAILRRAE